jgi:hypothetical protein
MTAMMEDYNDPQRLDYPKILDFVQSVPRPM